MKAKGIILGDAMIGYEGFVKAWEKYLAPVVGGEVIAEDFEKNWEKLQYRRLEVEKHGPEIEEVDETIQTYGAEAEFLAGLFVPVSTKVMAKMPNLRIVGVSRAGLENVNVKAATERGILVFNVLGRNAHAVSDFTVGMMLAEARNIARAHYSIKNHGWQKVFANDGNIPELNGKTVGLVGFGKIGQLVAKKLSGFDVTVKIYDPYTSAETAAEHKVTQVELNTLFAESDIVSIHSRLTEDNKHMIGKEQFDLMKPTALFINTGRAGLVKQADLVEALRTKKILGAALDVFETEPLPVDNPFIELDNVTLTTHIAGTTTDALTNSPFLLMEDIALFLKTGKSNFIVNPEVITQAGFQTWLASIKK